jgi:glycosyltransferase involved in cell wall biosynthesis
MVVAAIPCFNTEKTIQAVVNGTLKYVDRTIIIDDGSQDATAQIARSAGATVISHAGNKGYGEAIKSCFQAAKNCGASILVTLDGDGQHNPDEIPLVLAPVVQKKADLVIGSRFLGQKLAIPGYRNFGIRVINFLWNFAGKTQVSDTQSGFRAYSQNLIEAISLTETGMSVSIEIIEKARRTGAPFAEVPITCLYDQHHINQKAFKHGAGVALSVIRLRLH